MQNFSNLCKRVFPVAALVMLALVLALPMPVAAEDMSIFASIRRYEGVDPGDMAEIARHAEDGFLPIISDSDGFVGYYLLPAHDVLVAVSLFTSEEEASASNAAARDYVAENMAPLLPNPPQVVEGGVDIGFVEMLGGMGDGDVSSLHASVRLYDGFETDNLDAFVATVNDGFLPIMRETDGFFGYYLVSNSEGSLAAVSLFDSAASASASNEAAREFVAENLATFLPNAPIITSGQLDVAVLADAMVGANLIEDSVFISIRVYDGVDPADQDAIVHNVAEVFLPIMQGSDGFVGYYLLPADDTLVAISLFNSAEQAAASNEKARDYVAENIAPMLPNAPTIVEGTIDVSTQMMVDFFGEDLSPEDMALPLFGALRIYSNYDMSRLDETNHLVETILLPAQFDTGGLFAYFTMNDGVDTVAGFSVFVTEEGAAAANEIAADFVAEYLADLLPDDPVRINGQMGVAVREGVLAGVNAAEWDMME